MAAVGVSAIAQANTAEPVRPLAKFPPSQWGDMFLSFSLDNSIMEEYAKSMEEPKEQVRRLIMDPTMDSNKKLSLIYTIHRLGLTYMFLKEIEDQLDRLFEEFNLEDYAEVDLHTISINFQAFRHLGYKVPCDVFNKFKDVDTNTFKEYITSDMKGMLGLYEAAQLRLKGEKILDDASAFTETKLKSLVNTLEGDLAQQVKQSLERPVHHGMPMVEARLYFSNYREECSTHNSLLKLAKLHFNYLQLQQKEELRIVSKWWKDMKFQETTPYIRDRVPEIYFWILGLYFEPSYSLARIIATKITLFLVVLDDTYDAYATIEELRLLTDAINRWDISAISQLPEYIRPFYKILLNEYAELEKQLAKEGRVNSVIASKEAIQDIARGYLEEAEWTNSGYVPSFPEYTKNGLITSAYNVISKSALVGMGEIVSEDALAWYESHPKILQASELISRFQDDVMTYKFERERGQSATGVDAYIKTYGVSEKQAIKELKKMIENAWKDINEGCLKPREVSMDLLAPILNLARMIDVVYRYDDGFTFPGKTLKEYITLLFVDSLPM
ncbi:germacrene A synthase 2-like [Bidens hawaiensis]|uniref:germacrene A synthase 2-like n=1 Tax=Bidens hawaiensis TaxID=980011 RepID=UPI00404A73D8